MGLEDLLLAVVAATLFAILLLIRSIRREFDDWNNETEQWGPR